MNAPSRSGPAHGGGDTNSSHPVFQLTPWSRARPDDRTVYAGPRGQLFNLTVFDDLFGGFKPLKWKDLTPSHLRKIHVAFVSSDLSTLIHVHPEDYDSFAEDEESYVLEVPFNKAGKWGVLVEFYKANEEEEHSGHEGHHRRHEESRKTFIGTASITVVPDTVALGPADPTWPPLSPAERLPSLSAFVQFKGILLSPPPEDQSYLLPMIASDLALDNPGTPRSTALVNQTFLATIRTVPAVLQTNSCAVAVIEFFMASGDRWAPVTNLEAFLDAASHITTANSDLNEVGHSHATPLDPPANLGPNSAPASPTDTLDISKLPDLCSSHAGHPASPPPVFGSKLVAPLTFSTPGRHAIFAQSSRLQDGGFVHNVGGVGRVLLAPRFIIEVGTGMESTSGKVPADSKISSVGSIPVAVGPVDGMKGAELGSNAANPGLQTASGWAGIAIVLAMVVAAVGLFVWRRNRNSHSRLSTGLLPTFRNGSLMSPRIFGDGTLTDNAGVYSELADDFDEFLGDEDREDGSEDFGMNKIPHK